MQNLFVVAIGPHQYQSSMAVIAAHRPADGWVDAGLGQASARIGTRAVGKADLVAVAPAARAWYPGCVWNRRTARGEESVEKAWFDEIFLIDPGLDVHPARRVRRTRAHRFDDLGEITSVRAAKLRDGLVNGHRPSVPRMLYPMGAATRGEIRWVPPLATRPTTRKCGPDLVSS